MLAQIRPTTVSTSLGGEAARSRYSPGGVSDIGPVACKDADTQQRWPDRDWRVSNDARELTHKHYIDEEMERIERGEARERKRRQYFKINLWVCVTAGRFIPVSVCTHT